MTHQSLFSCCLYD